MSTTKTNAERIESIEERIRQLENDRKKILQAQKEADRKARTKRLCKRAGLLESLLPDTIPLTDEQFKIFLEKTVTTENARKILDRFTAQKDGTATAETAWRVSNGDISAAAKNGTAEQGAG